MDILQLYQDFNIYHATEGHRHCRPGWVNTECPFCTGNAGLHLGASLDGSHFYCWRCGGHSVVDSVGKLLRISWKEAIAIIKQYKGAVLTGPITEQTKVNAKVHKYPSYVTPLLKPHKRYLESRGFIPEQLEKEWEIMATGPISLLDRIDYGKRVLIPVNWAQKRVSFQARDVTGKHALRYITCPKEREIIHHKHILYGNQSKWGSTGIVTEGVTDVWRLGGNACCTFGIKYKPQQLLQIAKHFRRVAVVFDDDPQAVVEAKRMVAELREVFSVDAFRVDISNDPGSMSQEDADHLVKDVMKKIYSI